MNRYRILAFYLVATLVILRGAGLHLHVHKHETHDAGSTELVHLVKGGNHDAPHDQDVDVDVLNASLAKIPKLDPGYLLLIVLSVLLLSVTTRAIRLADTPRGTACRDLSLFPFRPPSTAPPA